MKEQHRKRLHELLSALKATGRTFPDPITSEYQSGWHLIFLVDGRGYSIVCHDFSYELETAEITGTPEDWELVGDVEAYRTAAEVTEDLVRLIEPPKQLT